MQTLDLIMKRIRDLPILNTEAYRLVDYCSQPEPSFANIEGMVKNNPNLCGQILRLANSATYKRSKPAETLADALVLLGLATLKQIFVQDFFSSVGKMLNTQSKVLDHGRECALLAEFIAHSAGLPALESSKARIGGLLHDIGKQFLAFFFPGPYEQVNRAVKLERIPSFQAEGKIFGVTHSEVGATLCAKWNFPGYLIDIIKTHHSPNATGLPAPAVAVYCANAFLHHRDGDAGQSYEQPLSKLFAERNRPLPWQNVKDDLTAFLRRCSSAPFS
jgi:putative nucleotidyltransferase with HDIG domain